MQIDRVHFYLEDTQRWRDWFVRQLGFQAVASSANNHTRTEVVRSGSVCFALSEALSSASPVAQFLQRHPPGVADVTFVVDSVEAVMARAVRHGVKVLQPIQQEKGRKWCQIAAWGSLNHTLIEGIGHRKESSEFSVLSAELENSDAITLVSTIKNFPPFTGIDHLVLNVGAGDLEPAAIWYENVLGFQRQQVFEIQTDRSSLHSQVMLHPSNYVQLPINEPASSNSQIQEFLDVNRGPGIQHIALQTPNLVAAIAQLSAVGVPFLQVPPTYYTELQQRQGLPLTDTQLQEIVKGKILVDWQEEIPEALLLQIFTQPIFQEPTFFFELIERRVCLVNGQKQKARGFGEGNFRALFEAIEREQIQRGSLKDEG